MAFDKKRAERSIVEVRPAPRSFGMGFRLLDDELIVTACHCLRRVRHGVVLPDPNALGSEPVAVKVRPFGARASAPLLVRFADPCSDIAVLGTSTADGTDLPGGFHEKAFDLISELVPADPELDLRGEARIMLYTHERKWVTGKARGEIIQLDRDERVRPGTSGAPVFTEGGRVLGIVSFAEVRSPMVRMCLLVDRLPGWIIRMAREATSRRTSAAGEAVPVNILKSLERAKRRRGLVSS